MCSSIKWTRDEADPLLNEGWLMKCGNPLVKDKDHTFEKIEEDFIEKFIPTNHASKAHHSLTNMHMEGEPYKGDFHKFKSEFELKAVQSGVMDEFILKDMLRRAVSANLPFKMMALLEELKTHKDWLWKAGQFYDAAICMCKLCGGTSYIPSTSSPKRAQHDPNTMDVNQIYLTLVQRAEHI